MKQYARTLWLIKRDFRLMDNEAFFRAIECSEYVLPVFVWEKSVITASDSGIFHIKAQKEALEHLQAQLKQKNGNVVIETGEMIPALEKIYDSFAFEAIFSHQETGNDLTFTRDKAVAKWAKSKNIIWHEYFQNGVVRREKNRDDRKKIWAERMNTEIFPVPENTKFPAEPFANLNDEMPVFPFLQKKFHPDIQTITEAKAHQVLQSFLHNRGRRYRGGISSPNTAFTFGSRLSPYLAWGCISTRYVWQQTERKKAEYKSQKNTFWTRSLTAFESRLHWKDHFIQRLESLPKMEFEAINPVCQDVEYENSPEKLEAFFSGKTGFPIIDAVMRCLSHTGFVNFRMRAMVVSFACFALHLDWRFIHPRLAQVFLDYEPGIHLSQLQMQAGVTGWNTVRVYSPNKQQMDQDEKAVFIKKWIPELRDFTAAEIHNYEKIPLNEYPRPIVDFATSSKAMKDQIYARKKSIENTLIKAGLLEKTGSRKPVRKRKKKVKKEDRNLRLF